jgi:protein-export membrane protein SecD
MLHFAKWKVTLVLLISLIGIVLALPNVLPQSALDAMPDWLPHKAMHLGLDLQGGAHVVLEVDETDLFDGLVEPLQGDVRAALREERIGYMGGIRRVENDVVVRLRDEADLDAALTAVRALIRPVGTGLFGDGGQADFAVSSDGGLITLSFTTAAIDQKTTQAIEQSIEIVRSRVDELGTTEPVIQRQGPNRILVQVPGLEDSQRLIDIIGTTARLQFRLICDTTFGTTTAPAGCEALPDSDIADQTHFVSTRSADTVEGADLVDAQPQFDQQNGRPIVSFRFNQQGAVRFGRLTQANVGKPFAIVLDDVVVSAPTIQTAILGGSGIITGNFTVQETSDLALVLRTGALPVKLVIVEERTVGPSLGADSIAAGKIASIIGLVAVVGFIIISYGLFGIFANLALAVNIALIVGVLSLFQATLTLPGIAGIVLTIGMAVDANVLIFERIREEVRNGKTPIASIDAGYSRALGTILDANITTLIAAIILFGLGSGPIKGFSVTLGIGIVTSVFTAFTLTRLIVSWWVKKYRPKEIPI